jgi:hypothetical protein
MSSLIFVVIPLLVVGAVIGVLGAVRNASREDRRMSRQEVEIPDDPPNRL